MIHIEKFLEKYYVHNQKIVLACSAGPDSMFLLYHILQTRFREHLVVCYFNHKTRPGTDEEEQFLRELSKKHNFIFEVAECDFEKIQKLYPSKSFEELAREKRYAFFNAILNIYQAPYVITAHHLDDRLETFYFNLHRGSKLSGLVNMQECSGNVLRPLLGLEKETILEYLHTHHLDYKIDETNASNLYTRNFLRNEIVPLFANVNQNYKQHLAKTLDYFADLKNFIDEAVVNFLASHDGFFFLEEWEKISIFLQKEVIRYLYYQTNNFSTIGLSEANIDEVLRFMDGKNNPTIKEIRGLHLKKQNGKIFYGIKK